MSDIFISYASADRPRAQLLAKALQERGWSVWWDRTIPPGRQFDEVIEEALDAARCVVVLWSTASTGSGWVKTEAAEAMRRKALIPAMIDDPVKIPLEFRRLQAADLTRWHGEPSTPEFEQFCAAIATELGANVPPPAPPSPPSAPPPPPPPAPAPLPLPRSDDLVRPSGNRKTLLVIGGVVVVLIGIAAVVAQYRPAAPAATRLQAFLNSGGIHSSGFQMPLNWRDYALVFTGSVSWDGSSDAALVSAKVFDAQTRKPLGSHQLNASVEPNAPGQIVVSTNVDVPGDSQTPGPHSHEMHLVFAAQGNGNWTFLRNCMAPNRCWP